MTEDITVLLARIKEQQEAKADALRDTFRGWSIPMLQARIVMLDAWGTIEVATHGRRELQHDQLRAGAVHQQR
jgi:hypothetical protein